MQSSARLRNAGQWAIGMALGLYFTPDFLHAAPRWLGAVALGTLGMIAPPSDPPA